MVPGIQDFIESLPSDDEPFGPRELCDRVVVTLRVSLKHRIKLDVIAQKLGKTRTATAGQLLEAAINDVWDSDAFGIESETLFHHICEKEGVAWDEFMTPEERYEREVESRKEEEDK